MAQFSTDVANNNLQVATRLCWLEDKFSDRGSKRYDNLVSDWTLCVVVSIMICGLIFRSNLAAIFCHGRPQFLASGVLNCESRWVFIN